MTVFPTLLHIDWARIHGGESFTPWVPLLAPLSLLYGAAVRLHVATALRGKRKSLPGFVVSIGNLTTGGTGKTPAVHMLAEWACAQGFRVAVLSRGYGGRHRKGVLEVSDGETVFAGPEDAGDEPFLLAKKLRGIPVLTAKDRYSAGLLARRKHDSNFFILDDGFQHLTLKRDLDMVLLDAATPFGNGHLLPRGPLREPKSHLKRADAFIITRSHGPTGDGEIMAFCRKKFPHKPLFRSAHQPKTVVFPHSGKIFSSEHLKGMGVVAFAGIARPDVFKRTLTELGAEIRLFRRFRDHHTFTNQDILDLVRQKEALGADCLITTEKDWVRVERFVPHVSDMAYLTITFTLSPAPDAFLQMVKTASKCSADLDP